MRDVFQYAARFVATDGPAPLPRPVQLRRDPALFKALLHLTTQMDARMIDLEKKKQRKQQHKPRREPRKRANRAQGPRVKGIKFVPVAA